MRKGRGKHQNGAQGVAVGYLRASLASQQNGPRAQQDAVERYAAARGLKVVEWASDIGVSGGTPPAEPDGFRASLRAIEAHGAAVLLLAKRDRLARDLMHAASAVRAVERLGARIVTADGLSADDTPEGKLLRQLVDAFAEFERSTIRARTKAALAARRDRGLRFSRHAPYGLRWTDDNRAVPVETEQAALRRMLELRADGLGYKAIGERLLAEGHNPRRANSWSITVVRRLILRHASTT